LQPRVVGSKFSEIFISRAAPNAEGVVGDWTSRRTPNRWTLWSQTRTASQSPRPPRRRTRQTRMRIVAGGRRCGHTSEGRKVTTQTQKTKPKKQPMIEISSRNHEISTNIAEDPVVLQSRGLVQKILFAAFYCQQQRDPVVHPDTKFFV
jgi:hypothetical protein